MAMTTSVPASLFHVTTADGPLLRIANDLDQAFQASSPELRPQTVVDEVDVTKLDESDLCPRGTLDEAEPTDNKSVVTSTGPDRQLRHSHRLIVAGISNEGARRQSLRLTVEGKEGDHRGRKLERGLDGPYRCPVRNISHILTCFTHCFTQNATCIKVACPFPLSQSCLTARKEYRSPSGLVYHLKKGSCVLRDLSVIDS